MGLFDDLAERLDRIVSDLAERGRVESHGPASIPPWPRGRSLVLEADTALELGNPAVGSLSCAVWGEGAVGEDAVIVSAEPGIGEGGAFGLAQIVILSGSFDDDYESYLDVRDALRAVQLEGVTLRSLPGDQKVWYRVSKSALDSGLTLAHVGEAIATDLVSLDFVDHAKVALIVGEGPLVAPLATLAPLVLEAGRAVGALVKRNEESDKECADCDFSDICEEWEGS